MHRKANAKAQVSNDSINLLRNWNSNKQIFLEKETRRFTIDLVAKKKTWNSFSIIAGWWFTASFVAFSQTSMKDERLNPSRDKTTRCEISTLLNSAAVQPSSNCDSQPQKLQNSHTFIALRDHSHALQLVLFLFKTCPTQQSRESSNSTKLREKKLENEENTKAKRSVAITKVRAKVWAGEVFKFRLV